MPTCRMYHLVFVPEPRLIHHHALTELIDAGEECCERRAIQTSALSTLTPPNCSLRTHRGGQVFASDSSALAASPPSPPKNAPLVWNDG